jgi:O-antigen ligase
MQTPLTSSPSPAWRASACALVFLLPATSLVTSFGLGAWAMVCIALLACLGRRACTAWRQPWADRTTRWVLLAFLINALLHAGFLAARGGAHFGALDKPLRMLLAAAGPTLVILARPPLAALCRGAAVGAIGAAAFAGWQRWGLGWPRAGGLMNPITFGDLSACLALLSLIGARTAGAPAPPSSGRQRRMRPATLLTAGGAAAGMLAALLSGSRGSWLVLLLALPVPLLTGYRGRRRLRAGAMLAALTAVLAGTLWLLPQTGVRERLALGGNDLRLYFAGHSATPLGLRLDLWRAGLRMAADHPWTGLSDKAYVQTLDRMVADGQVSPAIFTLAPPPHLHNDALQALANRGIPGLLAWAGTMAAPLWFFASRLRARTGAQPNAAAVRAPALAGLLLVLSYLGFGLTEVIFWSVKGSQFYALLVFVLIGYCLAGAHAVRPAPPAPP